MVKNLPKKTISSFMFILIMILPACNTNEFLTWLEKEALNMATEWIESMVDDATKDLVESAEASANSESQKWESGGICDLQSDADLGGEGFSRFCGNCYPSTKMCVKPAFEAGVNTLKQSACYYLAIEVPWLADILEIFSCDFEGLIEKNGMCAIDIDKLREFHECICDQGNSYSQCLPLLK
ncbi:MAG: hypothetical protein DPW09_10235 [Anaerolineae bacterium]|nr:hypothetical protein [Anaerolineales bacterium]MCQ3973811.1 hypothetical protein [Anaerolineae bacterium]